jgi:hypothetical protein
VEEEIAMRRRIAMLAAGALLALAPIVGWGQAAPLGSTQQLEQLLVDSADTPAEHQALARYYRAKAADAKRDAEEHRAMAKHYIGRPGEVGKMREHCDKIASLDEQVAAQYEAMAKGHEAAAGQ